MNVKVVSVFGDSLKETRQLNEQLKNITELFDPVQRDQLFADRLAGSLLPVSDIDLELN